MLLENDTYHFSTHSVSRKSSLDSYKQVVHHHQHISPRFCSRQQNFHKLQKSSLKGIWSSIEMILFVVSKIMILNSSCFYRQRITRKSWGTIFSSSDYRILLAANKRSTYVTCQHILKKILWSLMHISCGKINEVLLYQTYICITTCFDHPWFVRVRILCIWCSGRQIVMGS